VLEMVGSARCADWTPQRGVPTQNHSTTSAQSFCSASAVRHSRR
jgi:hypothetical protein